MAYRARIISAEISTRQLNVVVEYVDQAAVLPTITTAYQPHGMTRPEFLLNVIKPELERLNRLGPLKSALDDDITTARQFREADIS